MKLHVTPQKHDRAAQKAAVVIQRYMRGIAVRKRFFREISHSRLNRCFEHFRVIQDELTREKKGAIQYITYHWRKLVARRKAERELKRQSQLDMEEKERKKARKSLVGSPGAGSNRASRVA